MVIRTAVLWPSLFFFVYWILAMQKKTWKSAMLMRMWQSFQAALSLDHAPACHFGNCQWQSGNSPPIAYLIYRWFVFALVTSVAVASFACQQLPRIYRDLNYELNYFKWFIYFTNWGFMLISIQALLALILVYKYRNQKSFNIPGEDEESPLPRRVRTPLLCRIYWLTHTIATDLAFVITLIYWSMVHDPKIHEINTLNMLVHGGNSFLMLCELILTAHPFRAAHALYGAGAGLVYGLFSAVYWALGGRDRIGQPAIYPSLDWNKPSSALGFVALCAVVMTIAHALATLIVALRMRIAAQLCPQRLRHDKLTLPTH